MNFNGLKMHASFRFIFVIIFLTIACSEQARKTHPNIILFLADDLGYGDLSVYGHPSQEWGPIDQMATEGIRFTQVYSAASTCTPSRASILTGRQPFRTGIYGDLQVELPELTKGLPLSEITIAEALKPAGYTTGLVGKWHLGINAYNESDGTYLPHNQGFDYVGHMIPISVVDFCDTTGKYRTKPIRNMCMLYYGAHIIQQPIDLQHLGPRLLHDAKSFIYESAAKKSPFFLYYSFPHTHGPAFSHPDFQGKSKKGPYGDMLNEMAWSVGEILETLKELEIEKDTLVIFTSDNGPALDLCLDGGHPGPFSGGKQTYHEGGLRVPTIAWWPGTITPGQTSTTMWSHLDLLPTILNIASTQHIYDRMIDGKIVTKIMLGQSRENVHDALFFYLNDYLMGARYKDYKIDFREFTGNDMDAIKERCKGGTPPGEIIILDKPLQSRIKPLKPPQIYNVNLDPSEFHPLPPKMAREIFNEYTPFHLKQEKLFQTTSPRLLFKYMKASVSPCCNPPYCFCNYPSY